jgi:hypothetical protein
VNNRQKQNSGNEFEEDPAPCSWPLGEYRITLSPEAWEQFLTALEKPSRFPPETVEGAARFLREFHPEALIQERDK